MNGFGNAGEFISVLQISVTLEAGKLFIYFMQAKRPVFAHLYFLVEVVLRVFPIKTVYTLVRRLKHGIESTYSIW